MIISDKGPFLLCSTFPSLDFMVSFLTAGWDGTDFTLRSINGPSL